MRTKLSMEEIELAILSHRSFNIRTNIVVPNVSWGFLSHEADLLIMSRGGYLTEIEIKRSLSDLKADFKKDKHKEDNKIMQYFYYAVPIKLKEEAINLIMENKVIASGVITYTEDSKIQFHAIPYYGGKGSSILKLGGARKLFIEEQLQIARLGTMRVWKLKKDILKLTNHV